MHILKILSGPLIGAVIGYFTNYLAVKMLFRPLHPVKIGNWTLPFTPGVIPRGKARLARALGSAVGEHLLTKKDLEQMLLSDGVKQAVVSRVKEEVRKIAESDETIETFLLRYVESEQYNETRKKLEDFITGRILDGLDKMDVGKVIAEEGAKEVKKIGNKVGEYIKENGQEKIHPIVVGEIAVAEERPVSEVLGGLVSRKEKIGMVVEAVYEKFVSEEAGRFAEQFHIAEVV